VSTVAVRVGASTSSIARITVAPVPTTAATASAVSTPAAHLGSIASEEHPVSPTGSAVRKIVRGAAANAGFRTAKSASTRDQAPRIAARSEPARSATGAAARQDRSAMSPKGERRHASQPVPEASNGFRSAARHAARPASAIATTAAASHATTCSRVPVLVAAICGAPARRNGRSADPAFLESRQGRTTAAPAAVPRWDPMAPASDHKHIEASQAGTRGQ